MRARVTGAAALDAYARHLRRRGLADKTCALYFATARGFVRSLGTRSLARATRRHVEQFLAARRAALAPSTHADEAGRLRRFFTVMLALGITTRDPCAGLTVKPATYGAPLVLSEAAVARLLAAASRVGRGYRRGGAPAALRDRALVELVYAAGLRASELTAARAVDLNLREGTILVRRAKRGGQAVLPVPPSTVRHLRAYLREGRPALVARGWHRDRGLLLLTNVGTPIGRTHLGEYLDRIARRAGLRAHPHALRRALATHLVRAGASVLAVQELLGHARLDTTARYVDVERDDLRRAVALLDRAPSTSAEDRRPTSRSARRR